MNYTKPPLTFGQQADLLLSRGLDADRNVLISCLRSINYYRLSGYLYPYRNADDTFISGTTLDIILLHYQFDHSLRILVFDAIGKIEIAIRTEVAYIFSHAHGPFGHTVPTAMSNSPKCDHEEWLRRIGEETAHSKEIFVDHFFTKYGDCHSRLPMWMLVEILPMGALLTFFKGMDSSLQKSVAHEYGVPDRVFLSWLTALNSLRNVCAHHGRLWNRELGYKPLIPSPRKYAEWHMPVTIPNHRVFGMLTILKYLIAIIEPGYNWADRLEELLLKYPLVSRKSMGFPNDWESSPLWK